MSRLAASVRRRVWLVFLCATLTPGTALVLSLLAQKQYTARASLLFRDPGYDQKLFGTSFFVPVVDATREAATNLRLVTLRRVAEQTSNALRTTGKARLSAQQIQDMVDIAAEGQADVVTIAATTSSPFVAANVATELANQYIAFRRDADRSKIRGAERLLEAEIATLPLTGTSGQRRRSLQERANQLETLASLQTGNAELVQPAEVPTSPSSPKTLRNVLLGFLLGVLAGLGLAILFARLDRRIHDTGELEEIFDQPILARIPVSRVLQTGPVYAQTAVESEAFRMLRANLRYFNAAKPLASVLITSAAPGDGKSTVASNLAVAAASTGANVLLLEADMRQPTVSRYFGFTSPQGLSGVLAGDATLSEAVISVDALELSGQATSGRLHLLLSGPTPPNPAQLLESPRMTELLETASSSYDLVVVDTPPASLVSDAVPLMAKVDGVLAVARIGHTTWPALVRLHHQLSLLHAPLLGLVANAAPDSGSGYGYGYGYGYGQPSTTDIAGKGPSPVAPTVH